MHAQQEATSLSTVDISFASSPCDAPTLDMGTISSLVCRPQSTCQRSHRSSVECYYDRLPQHEIQPRISARTLRRYRRTSENAKHSLTTQRVKQKTQRASVVASLRNMSARDQADAGGVSCHCDVTAATTNFNSVSTKGRRKRQVMYVWVHLSM